MEKVHIWPGAVKESTGELSELGEEYTMTGNERQPGLHLGTVSLMCLGMGHMLGSRDDEARLRLPPEGHCILCKKFKLCPMGGRDPQKTF